MFTQTNAILKQRKAVFLIITCGPSIYTNNQTDCIRIYGKVLGQRT